jgi:NADH-quinone oxidoreductase subunit L
MLVVATVGAVTAFYSATIGLVQTDIKKVLAYSTVSQLGYMFLGLGVGAYAAGIFHLMTHAFFKGLLFLAAGSVIHAMGGEQDMRKMGGLREKIPVTYWTMFAATLAIAGVPLFSGFFSKEAILDAAKDGPHANITLWVLGILGAMLTSFYMFRLLFLTFLGKPRYDEHKVHVHESPKNMLVPLVILAALAVGGGWFALPTMIGGPDHFQNFLRPVFEAAPAGTAAVAEQATETPVTPGAALVKSLLAPGVIVALIGFLTAWWFYIRRPDVPKKLAQSVHGLYTLLLNKYYVDEFYLAVIVRPLLWISTNVLWHVVDENLIDGAVNGAAHSAREIGQQARQLQSGNTRSYAAWVIVGAVCVTVLVLGVWGMVR